MKNTQDKDVERKGLITGIGREECSVCGYCCFLYRERKKLSHGAIGERQILKSSVR